MHGNSSEEKLPAQKSAGSPKKAKAPTTVVHEVKDDTSDEEADVEEVKIAVPPMDDEDDGTELDLPRPQTGKSEARHQQQASMDS